MQAERTGRSGGEQELLETLRRIEGQATKALDALHHGGAKSGASALLKIKDAARDARRHHNERQVPGAALAEAVAHVYARAR